jgi:alpha-1,2-mannosyltransferase
MRRALIVATLAVVTGAFALRFSVHRGFFDLNVYYGALNYWVHDGGQLYDYIRPRTEYGFTYPPFAALTMLPMALVPWPVAIAISVVLTVGAMGLVLAWFVVPSARRQGWTPWFAVAVAAGLLIGYEPFRETFSFGQVNAVLLALVAGDALLLIRRGSRWGGVGIGLATAVKLTPGLFIVYLLITRRWRAAAVAAGTAAGATLLAGAIAPQATRIFWTEALWDTNRIGDLSYISNQSLQGMLARLDLGRPAWLVAVVVVLGVWAWRVRRTRDVATGVALTGVAGCLVSPVTWVHHLVWLVPALILLAASRRVLLAAALYLLLCSRLVWAFRTDFGGLDGFLFSNAYVWASLLLLLALPLSPQPHGVADLDQLGHGEPAGPAHPEDVPLPVRH